MSGWSDRSRMRESDNAGSWATGSQRRLANNLSHFDHQRLTCMHVPLVRLPVFWSICRCFDPYPNGDIHLSKPQRRHPLFTKINNNRA